MYLVLIALIEL